MSSPKVDSKENAKIIKELNKLKWRNRWSQQEIAFCCPIAPLKKAISKIVETNLNILKIKIEKQKQTLTSLMSEVISPKN